MPCESSYKLTVLESEADLLFALLNFDQIILRDTKRRSRRIVINIICTAVRLDHDLRIKDPVDLHRTVKSTLQFIVGRPAFNLHDHGDEHIHIEQLFSLIKDLMLHTYFLTDLLHIFITIYVGVTFE